VLRIFPEDGGPAVADEAAPGFPGWAARDNTNSGRAHPELAAKYALYPNGGVADTAPKERPGAGPGFLP